MTNRKQWIGAMLAVAFLAGLGGTLRAQDAPEKKDATAILDKAIQALGGEEKLSQAKAITWKTKGKITFMGMENPFDTQATAQGLDHLKQELSGEFGGNAFKATTLLAGEKGWREFAGNRMELDKDGLANEKRTAYLTLIPVTILPLKGKGFKVEAIGEEEKEGKPQVGIKAVAPDGKDFTLYFDRESGLPVRMVAKVADFTGGEFVQETLFSDYKEVEGTGIRKAMKSQARREGETFLEQQVTEFKVLEKVAPEVFADPK